jgi:hypothetical protein
MTDGSETIALRKTLIGGQTYPDDYTVIWRELPIGRIMRAPGLRRTSRNGAEPVTSQASQEAVVARAMTSTIASGSSRRHGRRCGLG